MTKSAPLVATLFVLALALGSIAFFMSPPGQSERLALHAAMGGTGAFFFMAPVTPNAVWTRTRRLSACKGSLFVYLAFASVAFTTVAAASPEELLAFIGCVLGALGGVRTIVACVTQPKD